MRRALRIGLAATAAMIATGAYGQPAQTPAKPAAAATPAPAPATPPAVAPEPAPPPAPIGPVYTMEQVRTGPLSDAILEKMKPVHTIDEAEAVLKLAGVTFGWRRADVDLGRLAPEQAKQLQALPPNDVFIAKQKDGGYILGAVAAKP